MPEDPIEEVEMRHAFDTLAVYAWYFYSKLIEQGFTAEQAIALTLAKVIK